jgi:acetate kinase
MRRSEAAILVLKLVSPQVLSDLRPLVQLAQLHQPHNLSAIEAVFEHLPAMPPAACLDTLQELARDSILICRPAFRCK